MEKVNVKKNELIFVIENEDSIYYFFGNRCEYIDSDNLDSFLESIESKIKSIKIFITDNNIFVENFKLNVSKANEAKSAALNMLLLNNVNNKQEITLKKVILKREDSKNFNATVFYSYLNISWFIDILKNSKSNIYKKLMGIYPLFQLFIKEKNFCYSLDKSYYTFIKDSYNISIFKKLESKNLPSDVILKEFSYNDLAPLFETLDDKLELNFISSGKYEFIEKMFLPMIILIVIFNIFMFSFLIYKKSKIEKNLNLIKAQLSQELKELEPFQEASDKYDKINKILDNVQKFKKASFPFNQLVESLAKLKKIWIRQISLSYDNVIISGKAESAFKVLETIKNIDFLYEAKISSKIIRDRNGFERFTIRAKYKNVFKN